MANYAAGSTSALILYKETSYGTASPDDQRAGVRQVFVSESIKLSQQTLDSATINSSRERSRPAFGNVTVAGSIATELAPQTCISLLALAVDPSPGAATLNTWTFQTGKETPSFTAEIDFGTAMVAGTAGDDPVNRFHRFKGCRISNLNITIPSSGFVTANYDVVGKDGEIGDTGYDPAPYSYSNFTPFTAYDCDLFYGTSGSTNPTTLIKIAESASISLTNTLDESIYSIASGGLRADLPVGFQTVTGQISLLLDNTEAPAFLEKINTKTAISLRFRLKRGTANGTEGNEQITLLMPRVLLERTSPEIQGPGGVKFSAAFKAFVDTPDTQSALTITVNTPKASSITTPWLATP